MGWRGRANSKSRLQYLILLEKTTFVTVPNKISPSPLLLRRMYMATRGVENVYRQSYVKYTTSIITLDPAKRSATHPSPKERHQGQ